MEANNTADRERVEVMTIDNATEKRVKKLFRSSLNIHLL
jgi:hypothetical protein